MKGWPSFTSPRDGARANFNDLFRAERWPRFRSPWDVFDTDMALLRHACALPISDFVR